MAEHIPAAINFRQMLKVKSSGSGGYRKKDSSDRLRGRLIS